MTPPPPPAPRERPFEDDLDESRSIWASRQVSEETLRVAAEAAERVALETGMLVSPLLVQLLNEGFCAMDDAISHLPEAGPARGAESQKVLFEQLRSGDWTSPSGRNTRGVWEILEMRLAGQGLADIQQAAKWLNDLVMGKPSWDGGQFASSAVWAVPGMRTTDEAAKGWRVRAEQLLVGVLSDYELRKLRRAVLAYRAANRSAGPAPATFSADGENEASG